MNITLFHLYIILGILIFFAIVLCSYFVFKSRFTKKYLDKNISTSPMSSIHFNSNNSSNTDTYYNIN